MWNTGREGYNKCNVCNQSLSILNFIKTYYIITTPTPILFSIYS